MASSSQTQRTRTAAKAVRVRISLALAATALALLAPQAAADKVISEPGQGAGQTEKPQGLALDSETSRLYAADEGNNRIDVFASDGSFAFAFGWGVDTGASQLQGCTTASKCAAGTAGSGAGQFNKPPWVAVDNDPLSPSHHDVYVGSDNLRIQKFDPSGAFLLAFGYDVVAQGPNDSANEEKQALTVKASGGTFKLKFEDPFSGGGTKETAPLPFNASAAEVAAALNSLSTIGGLGGSVAVSGDGSEANPYLIGFQGSLAGDDVPAIATDGTSLTGSPSIAVKEQARGGGLEVCEDNVGEACKRGSAQPGGECEISKSSDPIAVGPGGDLYVADSYEKGGDDFSRVIVFDSTGECIDEQVLFEEENRSIRNFTVDSAGNCYVTVAGGGGVIRKYDCSNGALLIEYGGVETEGIALDGAGNLFGKQRGAQVTKSGFAFFFAEYSPGGALLRRFGYVPTGTLLVPGLAVYESPDGDLYASTGAGVRHLSVPPPGPVVLPEACKVKDGAPGSTNAILQAEVNPEGKASGFRFEYLTQKQLEDEGGFFNPQKSPEVPLPGAADFELHEAAAKLTGLTPETTYHCRVVAKNADGESLPGELGSFKTKEGFEFGSAWASEVGDTSATLNAEGNPLGSVTKGLIEYIEDAKYQESGFAEALKTPEELEYGAGEAMVLRSIALSALAPGTLYHYRLRANNGTPPEGIVCPAQKPSCPELERTFRTYSPEEPVGFDERGYELVSPGEKNSAEVAVPGVAGGTTEPRVRRIQASAGSGEAVTYTSWTSFGEAQGAPGVSQYLSKRAAAGWGTENISPPGILFLPVVPPFNGFSADLRFGAAKVSEPSLAEGCPESYENFYLRDNQSGALQCLTPEAPNSPVGFKVCFTYAGASEDGSRAFFSAPVPYAGAPTGTGSSLYEWSVEEGLQVTSILPNGEAATPNGNTAFGAGGDVNCQWGQTTLRHAVSADGSRAFWTYAGDKYKVHKDTKAQCAPADPDPKCEVVLDPLFVRVNGSETIELDKVQSGVGSLVKSGKGVFRAASRDGSVVYFTSENRLVAGSNTIPGEEDLYRYEFGQAAPLTNLTTPGSVVGDVQGVLGASDDGSHVYFVAHAVLSEEENEAGQKAEEGKDNLYLFHGGKTSFIATLAAELDANSWSSLPGQLTARVSPDGKHLALLSIEAEKLAGYDNTIASGQHCQWNPTFNKLIGSPLCPQAFVYDVETEELTCASCNPSGSRPLGPAFLPAWTNVYEGPRYLSEDGSRLFFETFDALLPADENEKRDVYELELEGNGTCDAANPNFDPAAGGCHFLITSGKSEDESYLVDASSDGRDVFFSTRSQLAGWDVNEDYDVYDYREGGGFPEPPPPPPVCGGEDCKQALPSTPLVGPAPGTASFEGQGNVSAGGRPRCPKGKVRRRGRCIKPRKRGGKPRRKAAKQGRKAAR